MRISKHLYGCLFSKFLTCNPKTSSYLSNCFIYIRNLISKMIEDFALLDKICSYLPKEISKAKVKEIFEILKTQERPDLTQELEKLLLFKTNGNEGLKIAEKEKTALSLVNQALPTEMLKKILENLDIKSLCIAKQTCKRWIDVINGFQLVEKALSKFFEFFSLSKTGQM